MNSPPNKTHGSNPEIYRGGTKTTPPPSAYGSQRLKRGRDELNRDDFNNFKQEIKDMLISWKSDQDSKFTKLEETFKSIKNNVCELEKSLEYLYEENIQLRDTVKRIETDNAQNLTQIAALEEKVEDLQRNSKTGFVEIRNIPRKEGETKKDLADTVLSLTKALKVQIQPSDIRDTFRKPGKNNNNTTIVELSNSAIKNTILSSMKTYNIANPLNKLNATHIGFTDTNIPIFVSEHLTSNARRLHYLARELKKMNKIRYCWTSNGKVFIRKDDGLPAVLLKNESQAEIMKHEE